MFCLTPLGLEGSVLQMINHGLSARAGSSSSWASIYERRHTREIAQFGGLAHVMPVYATFTLIFFLASMGLPLLNGFIGEFMILQAAFLANPVWAYWAVSGVVLGAAYLLWLYQRVFWGKITNDENQHLLDLNPRELGDPGAAHGALLLDRSLPEAVPGLPAQAHGPARADGSAGEVHAFRRGPRGRARAGARRAAH